MQPRKKKKKCKKVQPTQQTRLLSWILTFSFCVCVCVSCSTVQFAKPFPSPEKFILFFQGTQGARIPHMPSIVIATTRASILRNGVLWGPTRRGARTPPCAWTCVLFAPVARALGLRAPPPCSAQLLILLSPVTSPLSGAVALFPRRSTNVCQSRE